MTSIRARLLWMLLCGLTLVLVAGGAAVYLIARAGLLGQFDDGLLARARTLASLVKLEPEQLIFESGDAPAATIDETFFELRTLSGEVLKRSRILGDSPLQFRDPDEQTPAFDDVQLPNSARGRAVWLAFRPRIDPEDWSGRTATKSQQELLIVTAAMDRRSIDHALTTLLTTLAGVGGAVAIAVVTLVAAGVRWGLRPVAQLSQQMADVSAATISQRVDGTVVPVELAPIYRELNRMLDRVEQALERERSFVDAAAHEFRTPLAELRTAADVALKWPDAERALATLAEVREIGGEMERLVESLLMISRSQSIDGQERVADVTMASIVDGCIERSGSEIQRKRLKLKVELDKGAVLRSPRTSEGAIAIILRNLISNAVQYTSDEGVICIREDGTHNGTSALIVENGPVALDSGDLPRLFEPFWRRDGSRSDRQHAGLGLTVVERIAAAVGLQVEASLADDRLRMRVTTAR